MAQENDRPSQVFEDADLLKRYEAYLSSPIESERTAAVSYLYGRYCPHAIAIARKLGADADVAQDIVQESFCNMCRYYRNPRRVPFRWYLATTVRNTWWKYLRNRRRFPSSSLDPALIECSRQNVVDRLIEEQMPEVIACVLKAIPAEARAIIEMRCVEGKTFREIGAELKMAPNTARSRFEEARQLFAEQLRAIEFKGAHK